jgi:hypothetical protein
MPSGLVGPKNHVAALLEGGLHDVLVLHKRVL